MDPLIQEIEELALGDFRDTGQVSLLKAIKRSASVCSRSSNPFVVEGDGYVSEGAILGIIEDLQNLAFLLPQAGRCWYNVQAFWREGRIVTDYGP